MSEAALNIEIAEGLLLEQRRVVMNALPHARAAGMQISRDVFGTGYPAMSYLQKFPIGYLKIDQSFVRDMVTDASDQVVVEAIIAMAHKLDMKVIARAWKQQSNAICWPPPATVLRKAIRLPDQCHRGVCSVSGERT